MVREALIPERRGHPGKPAAKHFYVVQRNGTQRYVTLCNAVARALQHGQRSVEILLLD